jgi:hypothetical protein
MNGLAWYCVIVVGFGVISCYVEAICGNNVREYLWSGIVFTPVFAFLVKYLKSQNKGKE